MKWLTRLSTLPIIGLLTGISLIFLLILFPHFDVKAASGGIELLDTRTSYSLSDVQVLFGHLDENGRHLFRNYLLLDSVFPLVYGALIVTATIYLQSKMGRLGELTRWMRLLPVLAILADYSENIVSWHFLVHYPLISENWVNIGSLFTQTKWILLSICLGLLLCGMLIVVLRWFLWKARNSQQI